ncbi:MFS transporter [Verrucomicrobium spinosum]|uniref:MFS transporter n=1 Tax=Verrucomicrobium spinosum TaxID=2736 RepID=UPI0005C5EEC1|nr:MFS transporter [Verrucomicrobium spinosum]
MASIPPPNARGRNMALTAAFLGWLFDGFEMGLFPLIGKPALQDLLAGTGDAAAITQGVDRWFTVIIATFLVGAASGGVFFGWLGDRIGRVRAMTFSIFTYAIFTGLCGFATEAWHVAILRFIASLGMGGEWALGVALVNELWTKGNRAWVAGAIGAAANIGYLLVAFLSLGMNNFLTSVQDIFASLGASQGLSDYLLHNQAWRFLMISGAFPAVLIFFIRLFVPESDKWEEEKKTGSTSHWSTPDLLGVLFGAVVAMLIIWAWSPMGVATPAATIITIVGFCAVVWGFLLPVRRYLQRSTAAGNMSEDMRRKVRSNLIIGATLAGIALLGTWGAAQQAPKWSTELAPNGYSHPMQYTQICTALGATVFALLTPLLADILNRRLTYLFCCITAMASSIFFFRFNTQIDTNFFISAFLMGGLTASFYGFFPLYLPELFPTAVRATGQGFCFNVGRIIAAIGGLQLANLIAVFGGDGASKLQASASAFTVLCSVYLVGMILIWFAPETKGKALQ